MYCSMGYCTLYLEKQQRNERSILLWYWVWVHQNRLPFILCDWGGWAFSNWMQTDCVRVGSGWNLPQTWLNQVDWIPNNMETDIGLYVLWLYYNCCCCPCLLCLLLLLLVFLLLAVFFAYICFPILPFDTPRGILQIFQSLWIAKWTVFTFYSNNNIDTTDLLYINICHS